MGSSTADEFRLERDELLQHNPIGFALFDRDLRYLWINDVLAAGHHLPPAEHVGRLITDVIAQFNPQVEQIYRRVLASGEAALNFDLTEVMPGSPNQHRYWLGSAFPVKTLHGTGPLLGVAVVEVTERAAAEQERRLLLDEVEAERQRLHLILQQLPVGVLLVDAPAGAVIDANEQVRRLLRQRAGSAAELHCYLREHAFHPDGRAYRDDEWPLNLTLRLGEAVTAEEVELRHADGETTTLRVSAAPLLYRAGQMTAAALTLVDLSAAKAAEARQRLLADATAVLASSLDYATTLRRVAQLAAPLLGDYAIVDVIAEDGSVERVAAAAGDPARASLAAALQQFPPGSNVNGAVETVLRTGKTVLVPTIDDARLRRIARSPEHLAALRAADIRSLLTVPLVARQRIVGVLTFERASSGRAYSPADVPLAEELAGRAAVSIDNARLYAAEQAARAAAETAQAAAEEALDIRDQFIAIAAHELRTPLTSATGYLQVLLRRLARGTQSPADMKPIMEAATAQLVRLSHLINGLLDVSRIAEGTLKFAYETVPVGPYVMHVVEQERGVGRSHTLTLHGEDGDAAVSIDPERFEMALVNLLQNAAKYSAEETAIDVIVSSDAEQVTIAVRDHGIGIPAEEQAHIFERFRRAGNVDKNVSGMGLGLYIAREIVHAHGGSIDVSSQIGEGSTFSIRLPRTLNPKTGGPDTVQTAR